jgi:hypothetical protein
VRLRRCVDCKRVTLHATHHEGIGFLCGDCEDARLVRWKAVEEPAEDRTTL